MTEADHLAALAEALNTARDALAAAAEHLAEARIKARDERPAR